MAPEQGRVAGSVPYARARARVSTREGARAVHRLGARSEGGGVALKPFVVRRHGKSSLDELGRFRLVVEGVAAQEGVCHGRAF